jgi:ABC-2 type transport system ATP-binding protein
MRAKLLLAATLSRKPSLLLLDEPTEGLDPESIEEVLGLIARWCASGERTVVIATHRLDEVERICDRVSILSRGRLLLSGNVDDLKTEWKTIEVFGELSESDVQRWEGVQAVRREGLSTRIVASGNPAAILNQLKQFPNTTCNIRDMNLREIYLAAIKRQGGIDYGVLEDLV